MLGRRHHFDQRLRSTTPVDLLTLTAWQMVLGAVPLVLLSLVVPEPPPMDPSYVGLLGFMSVASTAMCWWLWIYILDRVPAWEASLSCSARRWSPSCRPA